MTVLPEEVGEPKLTIYASFDDWQSSSSATSITWRLVWAVPVRHGPFTFFVDAVSGEVAGLRKDIVE
jgi:hypothetical protein